MAEFEATENDECFHTSFGELLRSNRDLAPGDLIRMTGSLIVITARCIDAPRVRGLAIPPWGLAPRPAWYHFRNVDEKI